MLTGDGKLTTVIRTTVQLVGVALLTFLVFYDSAAFRHPTMLVLVPMIPLALVFVAAPAAKTVFRESVALRASFTWWQGMWFLLFLSGLVFRLRAVQDIDQSALDFWAIYRLGLVAIVGLVLCVRLVSERTSWLEVLFSGSLGVLAIYSLLSVVSTVWSVRPPWTFYKSIEYLVDLATISAVVASVRSVREYRKFANWTWILLGLLVASAWIGAIIDPADGLLSGENLGPLTVRLEGVMPSVDANTIGEICAMLALVALNRLLNDPEAKHNRGWYGGLFSASLVTLVFSQTRAAMVGFVVGLAVMLFVTRRFALTATLGGISAIGAAIALTFTNFGRTFSAYLVRGQSAQELQGLSGRLDVWQASFDAFLRRPWTGYGGFAGSRFVVLPGIASQGYASSALSTYIDSLLDLGVWGPLLILVALAGAALFLLRATKGYYVAPSDRPLAVEMIVVLSVIIVRSFVTSNLMGHLSLAFLTVIGFVEVARREEVGLRVRMLARAA
jgi:O-antigen ligase